MPSGMIERLGNLGIREAGVVLENDDRPMVDGKALKSAFQLVAVRDSPGMVG